MYCDRGGNVFLKMLGLWITYQILCDISKISQSGVAGLVSLAEISQVPGFKFPYSQIGVRLYRIVGRNQLVSLAETRWKESARAKRSPSSDLLLPPYCDVLGLWITYQILCVILKTSQSGVAMLVSLAEISLYRWQKSAQLQVSNFLFLKAV